VTKTGFFDKINNSVIVDAFRALAQRRAAKTKLLCICW